MATTAQKSATKDDAAQADKAPKPDKWHACACLTGTGNTCSDQTTRAFARGHDARFSSRIAEAVAGGSLAEDKAEALIKEAGGSDLLVSKTLHSAKLRKEAKSGEGKPAKSTGKASNAKPAPPKSESIVGREVPVMHGAKTFKAVVVRTAAGDIRARHRYQGKDCDHELEQ